MASRQPVRGSRGPVADHTHRFLLASSLVAPAVVQEITSLAQFNEIINGDKVVAIDFWATWCGPCKVIGPVFEKLSATFTNIDFYKVDVDVVEDVAAEVAIKAMPTFLFFKKGEQVGKVVGADPNKLKAALELQNEA